ncbi:MAG: 4'-phosphopantetheinyl transferase superfamily protein [Gammaproteobacteria bacterium]|nr:4'-phosphopantetheinyl transferase superfamily protein [Gammaproteobacteria bacterium]
MAFSTEKQNYQFEEQIIDIWLCQSDALQEKVKYFCSLLSADEKARAERFKFAIHRHRFIVFHGFMRVVLAKYLKIDPSLIQYKKGEKGKPSLSGSLFQLLKFNLSHTQDLAVLAVTREAEVGVDIEHMERKTDWQGICQRFFTEPEQKALFSLSVKKQSRAFYELWTRKEAYMKVLGTGLALSPTEFTLTVPPEQPALIKHHSRKYPGIKEVGFASITLPDTLNSYCATVALASSIRECRYFQFS